MKWSVYVGMILISALFVFSSFSGEHYEDIANRITKKTAIKLGEEKNLHLIGTGGRMMDDIKQMNMGFYYYHVVELEEARDLMVYVIDEYLSEINSSKEIRPYLHESPFTAKNVEIDIWFFTSERKDPPLDKIFQVSIVDGIINYYIEGEKQYSRKEICKETYEEAKRTLLQQAK